MKKMIKKSQWLIVIKYYFCAHTWLQVEVSDQFEGKTSTEKWSWEWGPGTPWAGYCDTEYWIHESHWAVLE